jgi:hypothetical protein
VKPEDLERAGGRFQARLDALPPPTEKQIERIAALFAAIRLRIARDHARHSGPATQPDPPLSHPDHDGSNVGPSAHVSGVTGR